MMSATFGRLVRNAAPAQRMIGATDLQTRNISLKAVAARMKSVSSIKKITKAMKMVAAAKMKGDQRRLDQGMPFVAPVVNLFERLPQADKSGPLTVVGVSSDKGLCGGVNNVIVKACRQLIAENEAAGTSVKFNCLGNKAVAGLKRLYGDRFTSTYEGITKEPWCFLSASIIADRISASNPNRLVLTHNKFKSMVAYDTVNVDVVTKESAKSIDRGEWSKAMDVYSFEPPLNECFDDLQEFYFGSLIFGAQLESTLTEQSQRMSAMENASKNAGEMLEKLTLVYNRARQAKITTELCEIISGASAL